MIGVILCGGQSTRMGTDKGLLKLQADTWAKTAVDKMAALSIPVVLSVNANQYAEYVNIFPADQLIKDDESLQLRGPLYGVLSVHLRYPTEDLFVLACDMPLLDPSLLTELFNRYKQQSSFAAFVYNNDNEPEPLCGIYKSNGLSHIMDLYQTKKLFKHSMKYMLEHVTTALIPVPADQKNSFRNFNAHAELNGL
ncbi:MAG: molybdenum cofactor guanylyltransferase [Chitinophagaceae bacterium]